MGREWDLGDAAMVECGDGKERPATYQRSTRGPYWQFQDGQLRDADISDARSLVVIDAENDEQVKRLTDEYEANRPSSTDLTAHMQAALRSLIEPPKPPWADGDVVVNSIRAYYRKGGEWFGTNCDNGPFPDATIDRSVESGATVLRREGVTP